MSMLFKRFKDWATSITTFRTGDVIPVDGPSGTAKMPYSDLAKEVIKDSANNPAATEADLVAGSKIPIMTAGGPKALPGDAITSKTYAQNVAHSIAPEYNGTTGAMAGRLYMHSGVLYKCNEDTSGDWDSAKFNSINLDTYLIQLQENAGFASITASSKGLKVAAMVKKIAFYDPQNDGENFRFYLVTLVNSNQTLQITLEKGGSYYDFKVDEASQTGIKEYVMYQSNNLPSNSVLKVLFDWDAYQSVTGGTDLYVKSKPLEFSVIGYNGTSGIQSLSGQNILTPVKKIEKAGKVTRIYYRSGVAGTAYLLVGIVDENLKFIEKSRQSFSVVEGDNYLDFNLYKMYAEPGDNVAILAPGSRYLHTGTGNPDDRYAFLYGYTYNPTQLEAYGVEGKYAAFNFMFSLDSDVQEQVNSIEKRLNEDYATKDYVESEIDDYDKEVLCKNIGFSTTYSTTKGERVARFVKKINFCDFDNIGADYQFLLITTVSSGTVLQITLTYNNVNYDFKINAPDQTGVKEYVLQNDSKVVRCVLDWDAYQSTTGITDIYVKSEEFEDSPIGNTSLGVSAQNIKSILVPCKTVPADCKIMSIYNRSASAGTAKICVGQVDQLLRFNSYAEYPVEVASGENYIDVSALNIYAKKGDYVGIMTVSDRTYSTQDGTPTDDKSFYYSTSASNIYQLVEYGVLDKRIIFRFGFTYNTSTESKLGEKINELQRENTDFESQLDIISGNIGFAYDSAGNKYKTRVVDGFVKAFALNFKHILVVGNSYTVHPTTEDTGVLATNRWWGHWSMAATKKETAWTTLLENNLKARDPSSTVQPIFGRTYEMNGGIDNNDSFVYWDDNGDLQTLYQNVSDFSNTDCVIFFLGDNYNGDDWYSRYKTMVEKFETLFPNTLIYCMSARSRSSVNTAILQVATEKDLSYINVYGKAPSSRIGSYVSGDDGTLHQIADNAVAGHPGDYGQKDFVEIVSDAIAVDNIASFYNITLNNPSLEIEHTQRQAGAIVSVFGGDSVASITVMQGDAPVDVTAHLATPYGNVFTFVMPAGDVSIS